MYKIIECEQRSDEWFAARAGRVTGSRAADVTAKIKTGEAAARRDYKLQLAIERLTGRPVEDGGFVSADMQRGIDLEAVARAEYVRRTGLAVRETGFVISEDMPIGCSVDGDVGEFRGILEIKCPKSWTHIQYLKAGALPPVYRSQVIHNMLVTDAQFCDFVSFDDRLPEGLQFFHIRYLRSANEMDAYRAELNAFLVDVETEYQALLELKAA